MKNPIWGYDVPYLLSELGSTGYWDPFLKSQMGCILEETDEEKSKCIKKLFTEYKQDETIIGSYVFYWGQKQECTPTWFSLFGKNGEYTPMLHEIKNQWIDETSKSIIPKIKNFNFKNNINKTKFLYPSTKYILNYSIENKGNNSLNISLELLPEETIKKNIFGNEIQHKPINIDYKILENEIHFTTPVIDGKMRLFLYVKDNKNNITSRNLVFFTRN